MRILAKKIAEQQFLPGILGIFINPFYFVRRELAKEIKNLALNMTGDMLDVGCGQKPYKDFFSRVDKYIGMEYDNEYNKKYSQADIFYDGRQFPLEDNSFNSVMATQVLEHIFNPIEFLSEINRILKPGGKLLLTVPFVWDEHSQPNDYARYSSFGLTHLLSKHGFEIIRHKKTLPDIRVIFQLINCYLFKILPTKNYRLRLIFYTTILGPINILGIALSKILPSNKDLYLDNIILSKKK